MRAPAPPRSCPRPTPLLPAPHPLLPARPAPTPAPAPALALAPVPIRALAHRREHVQFTKGKKTVTGELKFRVQVISLDKVRKPFSPRGRHRSLNVVA